MGQAGTYYWNRVSQYVKGGHEKTPDVLSQRSSQIKINPKVAT